MQILKNFEVYLPFTLSYQTKIFLLYVISSVVERSHTFALAKVNVSKIHSIHKYSNIICIWILLDFLENFLIKSLLTMKNFFIIIGLYEISRVIVSKIQLPRQTYFCLQVNKVRARFTSLHYVPFRSIWRISGILLQSTMTWIILFSMQNLNKVWN